MCSANGPMAWCLLTSLLCLASAAPGPVANTLYGPVRGIVVNGTKVWRGIPYAAAPVGDLRFRPPQPPEPWNTILEAVQFGASCLQYGSPGTRKGGGWPSLNLTNSSEDCLFANVYAPDVANQALPVMLYLHAGEFNFGSSNDAENNFPHFARRAVVLVTANVRLGYFGFAALDKLRSRDPEGSSGNYGMQDQRAVLRWVKQSISRFGGDPEKITIFGESSGGSSVAFHLVSNSSQGLYSKAIMESPGLTQSKSWTDSVENTQYVASVLTAAGSSGCTWPSKKEWSHFEGLQPFGGTVIAYVNKSTALHVCGALVNCSVVFTRNSSEIAQLLGGGVPGELSSPVGFRNATLTEGHDPGEEVFIKLPDSDSAVDCLLNADPYDLANMACCPPHSDTFRTDAAAPTVDGVELLEPLEDVAISNIPAKVPLLAGANLDEGTEFMYLVPHIACNASDEDFMTWAVEMFGAEFGPKVPLAYATVEQPTPLCRGRPGENTSLQWVAAMRSAGDGAILCRTRALLQSAERKGNPVWWYYFTHTPLRSVNMPNLQYEGAFHGAEVPFVFGDDFELSSTPEKLLSKAMGCYWINFAASGNPNAGPTGCTSELSLPEWPVFGQGNAIEFSTEHIRNRPALKQAQCEMFANLFQRPHESAARETLVV